MATDLDLSSNVPDGGEAPEPSLHDALDAAFREHATDEVDEPPAGGRARDDLGRFAKEPATQQPAAKAPAAAQEAAAGAPGTPGIKQQPAAPGGLPAAPQPTELKAPASWTPSAREKWATVPPEIQGEIHRREHEAQRVLQESAGLREFARTFQDIVRPYEMFIRSENSDPLRAVQSLMNTAGQLRVGTPATKVGIVANIIRQHNVDLAALDSVLAGMYGVTQGQPLQQAAQDPRVDQLIQWQQQQAFQAQQAAQAREAWESNAMQQGLAAFAADPKHEFFNDVRETMADLVDAASRRGQTVDLENIYARACQLDPEVSKILTQRGPAQPGLNGRGAPGPSQAVLRARRAAVSVKGDPSPAGSSVPKNDSIRAAIEAAIDAHSE